MDIDIDDFRVWYDDIDFGVTSTSAPLQSAILCQAVSSNRKKLAILDDETRRFANISLKSENFNSECNRPMRNFSVEEIVAGIVDATVLPADSGGDNICAEQYALFPPPCPADFTYPATTQEVFQFAHDLDLYGNASSLPTEKESGVEEGTGEAATSGRLKRSKHHNISSSAPGNITAVQSVHTVSVACQTSPSNQPSSHVSNINNSATTNGSNSSSLAASVVPHQRPMFRPPATAPVSDTAGASDGGVKKNPFVSAKAQFVIEGGHFKDPQQQQQHQRGAQQLANTSKSNNTSGADSNNSHLPLELQQYDAKLVEKIQNEILQDCGKRPVVFADIAGLEFAKKCVQEIICWPMMRPDLFRGLRALPKGLLLFGPPGTGKTLIGKAIANQTGATFFSISASSLTSKWVGESEAMVRVLFAVAAYHQPSVVFIDEVDSLLTQRSSEESEASRRIKTEFLVQLDGAGGGGTSSSSSSSSSGGGGDNNDVQYKEDARVVVIGATNRPEELDEAARRRFAKRLYIPLPNPEGRKQLVGRLLEGISHVITEEDEDFIVEKTQGFSGADVKNLCTEASLGPVREVAARNTSFMDIRASDVPPISMTHFLEALQSVGPSVSAGDLDRYIAWNTTFGTYRRME